MSPAEKLAISAAGIFFLSGLLSGVWKYQQIQHSDNAQAHPYVDICHRASLMYAFATILLVKFIELSQLPDVVELLALSAILIYFSSAIFSYFIHGLLQDTDNQLSPPFRIAQINIPAWLLATHMWMLIAAEIIGFLVLFYGVLSAIL